MRSVPEWVGRNDDDPFPPRVRLRILRKFGHRCAKCTRPIRGGDRWTCDHVIASINGGKNRESNGQPLCAWCNPGKNRADVAEKAKDARVTKRHFGLTTTSNPVPGSRSTPLIKRMNGAVEWRPNYRGH